MSSVNVSRVYRLLRLVTLLQSGRSFTAQELAEELQISRRTVFRDLNALEMAHIPYYYDPANRGYRISRHFFLPPVNLTLPEAMCLLLLSSTLGDNKDIPLLREGVRAAAKIEGVLPDSIREHAGSILENLQYDPGPMARHDNADEWFDDLAAAVMNRRVCRMQYHSFHDETLLDVEVHPLRLSFIERAWYLLAWTPEQQAVRTYKVLRIRELDVREKTFLPPEGVDLTNHFGQAWNMIPEGTIYPVHLRFERMVAGNVAEVSWHATQETEWNDDGTLSFRAEVDGLREITWWVLGYGDQVTVVDPPELRRRVAEHARTLCQRYADDLDGEA
jgi:proteasome accessory factor B